MALTKFDEAKDKDIILAIGNTGSGKSTMLTSLIYGTDYLILEKQTYQIQIQIENSHRPPITPSYRQEAMNSKRRKAMVMATPK